MHESITLSFTGNSTVLSANYFPSLNVYEDSEIALLSLQTFNSFPNIINPINNRLKLETIPPKKNKEDFRIFEFCLEDGCYEIEDINNYMAKELSQVNNDHGTHLTFSIRMDPVDFRTYIKCNGILRFNTSYSIAPVFGFKKKNCGPFHEERRSDKAVNLNTINSIKVMCNIAHGSFNNQLQSHSIHEFFPSGKTGTKVVQSPVNLIYYRLNKTDINSITVQLVDQNNNPIDNFNETLTVVLHIKRHGSHH